MVLGKRGVNMAPIERFRYARGINWHAVRLLRQIGADVHGWTNGFWWLAEVAIPKSLDAVTYAQALSVATYSVVACPLMHAELVDAPEHTIVRGLGGCVQRGTNATGGERNGQARN